MFLSGCVLVAEWLQRMPHGRTVATVADDLCCMSYSSLYPVSCLPIHCVYPIKAKKNPKTNVSFKLETSKSEQQVYESEQLVQEDALFFNTR